MKKKVEEPKAPLGPPIADADVYAQQLFQQTASTGMVVVVVRNDETWIKGYGRVTPFTNDVPGPLSLLRLCSISKILATDLLAKLKVEGKLKFDDPLQKYAPEGVDVPTKTVRGPALRDVTLFDLATHSAGFPREIAYPPQGMAHFTFPDYEYRWNWIKDARLRFSPGDAAHYSNIGFDYLGDALAAASGESYEKLFEEKTAQPLGLQDTTLTPNEEQCQRLMSGAREPSECTNTEAAAGSGGMYSTAQDMAKLLKYFLKLPGVPMHQNGWSTGMYLDPKNFKWMQGLGHAGVPTGIGLGWIEINGDKSEARIVQKTGGGAGFQTYIALDPARHAGIFVASTESRRRGGINMFHKANDMLLALAGLPPLPEDKNDPERNLTAEELNEAREEAATKAAARSAARRGVRARAAAPANAKRPAHPGTTRAVPHPAARAPKPTPHHVRPHRAAR